MVRVSANHNNWIDDTGLTSLLSITTTLSEKRNISDIYYPLPRTLSIPEMTDKVPAALFQRQKTKYDINGPLDRYSP